MKNDLSKLLRDSRRRFLKDSGTAVTATALGAGIWNGSRGPTGVAQAQTGDVITSNGFSHAGIWYFHPSIFEYPLGPWQPYLPANPDLIALWKLAIDWFADHGLDFVVLHFAPYGGDANPGPIAADRVRFGWGYHYTLDFNKFPEAKVFDADFVRRNQSIVQAVTEYGRAAGVDVFFHHYNFMMTMPFAKAHPELFQFEYLKRGNWVDLNTDEERPFRMNPHSQEKRLVFNVCWNKALYQDFMVACFEEFFEQFPAAAGILVTPGERALCQCIECIGEQPTPEEALRKRFQDSPQKRKTIAHFCDVFSKTLVGLGKTPLIRSWICGLLESPEKWAAVLPKGPTYVMKYSVFDMTDTGVDPLSRAFQDAGHKLWLMKEYVGGENAGNVVVTLPDALDRTAAECRRHGIQGVMGVDNGEHGFTYKSLRVQYLPELLFANSFGKRRWGNPEKIALDYYQQIFHDVAPEILRAVKSYSLLPYNISRVIWERTEGFTWKFPYHFSAFPGRKQQTGWPGTLAYNLDAPQWARREIAPLIEYVDYADRNRWDDQFRARITGKRTDPIQFLGDLTRGAKQGLDTLLAVASQVPVRALPELNLLVDSAKISYLTGKKWTHFLMARLLFAGAKGPNPAQQRKTLGRQAIDQYRDGLAATRRMVPIFESFPSTLCDPSMTLLSLESEVAKRQRELEFLTEDLAASFSDAES